MKYFRGYFTLFFILILSCATKNITTNNIKVHFKSLGNDFAAVDMSLYDNNKFEIKTATIELHGNKEFITELKGTWVKTDSNYILKTEKLEKEQLMEYFFSGWKQEEIGFGRISKNKVSFPVDKEILIINNVKCLKQ